MLSQGLGFNISTLASLNVTIAPIGTRMNCSTFIRLQFQFCVALRTVVSVYMLSLTWKPDLRIQLKLELALVPQGW